MSGMGREAIDLYHRMPKEYADQKVYGCALTACSHSGLIDEARRIFNEIQNPSAHVYSTMVRRGKHDFHRTLNASLG